MTELHEINELTAEEVTQSEEAVPKVPQDPEEGEPLEQSEDTDPPTDPTDALRQEIEQLRAALAQKEQEQQRTLREIGEFHRLFPDISVSDVPDGVWDSVDRGIPLSAAYALYEKKRLAAQDRAEAINRRNASLSAGQAGTHTAGEYFSPDEVRAMSQRQVHHHYRAIMESMKHWH